VSVWEEVANVLLEESTRYSWECSVPACDGNPHEGNEHQHGRSSQQLPDGDWNVWLLQAGRGFGKTRAGAESLVTLVQRNPVTVDGFPTEWLLAGPTFSDTREVLTQGPSGVLNALNARRIEYTYNRANGLITLASGQRIHMKGGDQHDLARGLNLAGAWTDEVLTWRRASTAWFEGLLPSLRQRLVHGKPRIIATSTPKAAGAGLLSALLASDKTHRTTGSTFDNLANLSADAVENLRAQYPEGSRLWRIELAGEWIEQTEGALFSLVDIDENRVGEAPEDLASVVVSVDPAVSSNRNSDSTGIVTVGSTGVGSDREFYVLCDDTLVGPPAEWAKKAVLRADEFSATIIYETNQGGDAIKQTLEQSVKDLLNSGVIRSAPVVKGVRASKSKAVRAAPVAAQYELGKVHHVGEFVELENELTNWVPSVTRKSPDRLDGLVHGVTYLFRGGKSRVAAAF
jgi:phage terminase large subunit-like protein